MTLTREYTVLIGDPIAVQILTHNPSLSSVSRYPVAFEFPRAEARHHQPDLPRAPTPRAFARISSLLHRHPPAYPVPYVSSLIIQHHRRGKNKKKVNNDVVPRFLCTITLHMVTSSSNHLFVLREFFFLTQ